jgi:rfaE bifunctional protein nucleotidyltransferase chain/domain
MTITRSNKIKTTSELKEQVRQARADGKSTVLTNGCFDLIHVGHVRCLEEAKGKGDILIVAINSDASVGALKGAGRPLQSESERAEILAAFECVDFVVIFDSLTVDPLLLEIRPDIHAKGTDYTSGSVPERKTVLSYGGRVAIVGDPKDHSTKDMIRSILMASDPCARLKES